jgi:hypothetical protein
MRIALVSFLSAALAMPVAAQDVLGPVNPTDYTGAIALGSAIDAQARDVAGGGDNWRGTGFSQSYVREQCAGLPRDRAVLGAGHRRVVRWVKICRSARLLR